LSSPPLPTFDTERPSLFYDFVIQNPDNSSEGGLRLLFLDGYEVSLCEATSPAHHQQAEKLLSQKNKNLSVPGGSWFEGLENEVDTQ